MKKVKLHTIFSGTYEKAVLRNSKFSALTNRYLRSLLLGSLSLAILLLALFNSNPAVFGSESSAFSPQFEILGSFNKSDRQHPLGESYQNKVLRLPNSFSNTRLDRQGFRIQPRGLSYISPEPAAIIGSQVINSQPKEHLDFLGQLHETLASNHFQRKIDQRYRENLKTFIYFHGFEATSRDLWGQRRAAIDQEEEEQLRKDMAEAVLDYMLIYGIPRFLRNRPNAGFIDNAIVRLEKFGQIKGQFGKKSPYDKPWKFRSGFHVLRLQSFANLSNGRWLLETVNRIGISNQPLEKWHILGARNWGNYSLGLKYDFIDEAFIQYLGMTIRSRINAKWENILDVNRKGEEDEDKILSRIVSTWIF